MSRADGSLDPAPADDRLEGSVVTAVRAASAGASMIRVHDVAATVAALRRNAVLQSGRPRRRSGHVDHEQRESSRWL